MTAPGSACNPPEVNTDPPPGPATFTIYRNNLPVWSRTFVPGPTLAYGPNDLIPASAYNLGSSSNPIAASLWAPDAELVRPLEAQLYIRDPDEVVTTLENVLDKNAFLAQLVTPVRGADFFDAYGQAVTLPDGVAMPFPAGANNNAPTRLDLTRGEFGDQGAFGSPATGTRQVRAVRLVQRGLCSRTETYLARVAPAQAKVQSSLQSACNDLSAVRLDWLTIASFLRHHESVDVAEGPSNAFDARGGFMVNGGGYAKKNLVGDCNFKFNAFYELSMVDGIAQVHLTRPPLVNGVGTNFTSSVLLANGICDIPTIPNPIPPPPTISGAVLTVKQALDNVVVTTNQDISNKQAFSLADWLPVTSWSCDPTRDPALGDGCQGVRDEFAARINAGAMALLGVSASPLDPRVADLVAAANALDNGGRFHNWSCVPVATPSSNPRPAPWNSSTDPRAGKCRYTLRARRLITSPDDVRVVWFDNIKDYTNPALSFYFYVVGLGPGAAQDAAAGNFCTSQTSPPLSGFDPYFNRPFTVVQSKPLSCGN